MKPATHIYSSKIHVTVGGGFCGRTHCHVRDAKHSSDTHRYLVFNTAGLIQDSEPEAIEYMARLSFRVEASDPSPLALGEQLTVAVLTK